MPAILGGLAIIFMVGMCFADKGKEVLEWKNRYDKLMVEYNRLKVEHDKLRADMQKYRRGVYSMYE